MQEIPPDLGGWLAKEERNREERDDEELGPPKAEKRAPTDGQMAVRSATVTLTRPTTR